VDSLRNCLPAVEAAGFEHGFTYTAGNPYISGARAEITRKALDWGADIIVYIDHDVSFDPEDMVKLLKTEGDVVGGTYRCKVEDEGQYMGAIYTHLEGVNEGKPIVRADGAIKARTLPAGFLRVTTNCIDKFMRSYPELCYGPQYSLSVDLFNHGAHEGIWWGEDYAFCRRWEACGGENWLIPNMNIGHWEGDKCYEGNYHLFLSRQPGGANDPAREEVLVAAV
jgi:glycosyltransferase involved in cell wall biosynthesis